MNGFAITLLDKSDKSELARLIRKDHRLNLTYIASDPQELSKLPDALSTSVPGRLIVVNLEGIDKQVLVTTSLRLRNGGHQVIITVVDDFDDLLEIINDVGAFILASQGEHPATQTEVIVTDNALDMLGDVSYIVAEFERRQSGSADDS